MSCELMNCCPFFVDNMKDMPIGAEYIKKKFCFDSYASCNRYLLYKEFGGENIPHDLNPGDYEAMKKVLHCLQKKTGIKIDC